MEICEGLACVLNLDGSDGEHVEPEGCPFHFCFTFF